MASDAFREPSVHEIVSVWSEAVAPEAPLHIREHASRMALRAVDGALESRIRSLAARMARIADQTTDPARAESYNIAVGALLTELRSVAKLEPVDSIGEEEKP